MQKKPEGEGFQIPSSRTWALNRTAQHRQPKQRKLICRCLIGEITTPHRPWVWRCQVFGDVRFVGILASDGGPCIIGRLVWSCMIWGRFLVCRYHFRTYSVHRLNTNVKKLYITIGFHMISCGSSSIKTLSHAVYHYNYLIMHAFWWQRILYLLSAMVCPLPLG